MVLTCIGGMGFTVYSSTSCIQWRGYFPVHRNALEYILDVQNFNPFSSEAGIFRKNVITMAADVLAPIVTSPSAAMLLIMNKHVLVFREYFHYPAIFVLTNDRKWKYSYRADSRLTPSQWETSLQSNTVSHWLSASLASARSYVSSNNFITARVIPGKFCLYAILAYLRPWRIKSSARACDMMHVNEATGIIKTTLDIHATHVLIFS